MQSSIYYLHISNKMYEIKLLSFKFKGFMKSYFEALCIVMRSLADITKINVYLLLFILLFSPVVLNFYTFAHIF